VSTVKLVFGDDLSTDFAVCLRGDTQTVPILAGVRLNLLVYSCGLWILVIIFKGWILIRPLTVVITYCKNAEWIKHREAGVLEWGTGDRP
jgi:hypothetical protein